MTFDQQEAPAKEADFLSFYLYVSYDWTADFSAFIGSFRARKFPCSIFFYIHENMKRKYPQSSYDRTLRRESDVNTWLVARFRYCEFK